MSRETTGPGGVPFNGKGSGQSSGGGTNGSGAAWEGRQSLRLLILGDSHAEGQMRARTGAETDSIGVSGLTSPLDESWGPAGVTTPYPDNNAFNTDTGSTDSGSAGLAADHTRGSFVNRIPRILRAAYPWLGKIRVCNGAIGGSKSWSWAGESAYWYVHGADLPQADDWIEVVGSVTTRYVFKAAAAAANEVTIGADVATTIANLAKAINGMAGGGYGAGTVKNPDIWVPATASPYLRIHCRLTGAAGNAYTIQSSNTARFKACDATLTSSANPVLGSSGADISAIWSHVTTALAYGEGFGIPDVVLVCLGTNDAYQTYTRVNAPSFASHVTMLVGRIRQTWPVAQIILWKPPASTNSGTTLADIINPAVEALVAAQPQYVSYVNAYGIPAGSNASTNIASDGTHQTPYGYELDAQLFAAKIAERLRFATPSLTPTVQGGDEDSGFCRVIPVTTNPTGSRVGEAGQIAVLNATQGTGGAPGIFFCPSGGTSWIRVPAIMQTGQSLEPQPSPGTFRLDSQGNLYVFVDATTTAMVPVTYLKVMYANRERIASLLQTAPGMIWSFNQELDPNYPLNLGPAGVTLDGEEIVQKVGAVMVSYNGKRAYQRRAWFPTSPEQPHATFWKPLHTEIVQNTTLGAVSEMISPNIDLWKTGACKIILRGHLDAVPGAFGLRMTINRDDAVHAGHFQTYKWSKHTRRVFCNELGAASGISEGVALQTVSDDADYYSTPYGMLNCETPASHDAFGAGVGNPPAWFYLELHLPDPRDYFNFMPIRWKLWTSSTTYHEGVPQGNQIPIVQTDGEAMIWNPDHENDPNYQLQIRKIGFQTMAAGEGGFVVEAAFGTDVEMEVTWP